jgi:hypothetical protein
MDWEWWKGVAALLGMVLGIINTWMLVCSKRPVFVKAPGKGEDRLTVQVVNPSSRPLQINRAWQRGFRGQRIGIFTDRTTVEEAYDWLEGRGPYLYVPPGSTRSLDLNTIKDGYRGLVILWWHRLGLAPAWPHIFYLSRKIADEINKGHIDVGA